MDTLNRLAEKNRKHKKHKFNDKIAAFVTFIGLLPFYIDAGFTWFVLDKSLLAMASNLVISGVGSLSFALTLMGTGDLLLFPRVLKITTFILLESWFTYFWVFIEISWVAFIPLVPVYVLFKYQAPEIIKLVKEQDDL